MMVAALHKMYKHKVILILLVSIALGAFEVPRGVPNASLVGFKSTVTGVEYNTDSTLHIQGYTGINESQIAKRKYKELFDYSNWNLDELFPDRERELAYKYYKYIPGVVWIEKKFFIDETEIANIHWQEFCLSRPEIKPDIQNTILPADYFSNPRYSYYPVTGITHDEAEEFCEWRTTIATQVFNRMKGYSRTDPEYTVFRFRLPTRAEWEKCAGYGLDLKKYPHGVKVLKSKVTFSKKAAEYLAEVTDPELSVKELNQNLEEFNNQKEEDLLVNCKRIDHKFLNLRTPFSVWSYPKNHFGIYNMIGNVGELVEERNLVKGGSWLDPTDECQILAVKDFTGPAENIGFRTVCVLEWPNKKN
jgi:formylglycine-generating enzyme required for sulfatase activity